MNGDKFVVDTDFALHYINRTPVAGQFIKERRKADFYVSVVTRIEMLSYHALELEDEIAIHHFLEDVTVVPLTEELEKAVVSLRRATRRKLADSIIAATAVRLGATLVTADKRLAKTTYPGLKVERVVLENHA